MAKETIELLASYWTLAGDVYALGPTEVSPFPFHDRVEAAAHAGYVGMGLLHADFMKVQAEIGYKEMRRILDQNGIKHVELEFLGNWFTTGEEKLASDRQRAELLEAAEALRARDIKIAPKLFTNDCDVARYTDAFGECCREAAKQGTEIVMEILPMTNVATLERGLAIVSGAGAANGGLLIDIWHMARGGIPYDKVAAIPSRYLKSVELDDADQESVGDLWEDTLHHRRLPGEGVLDCPVFIRAVQAAGYRGFYGVEIISRSYRKQPLAVMAKTSFEATMRQFAGS